MIRSHSLFAPIKYVIRAHIFRTQPFHSLKYVACQVQLQQLQQQLFFCTVQYYCSALMSLPSAQQCACFMQDER